MTAAQKLIGKRDRLAARNCNTWQFLCEAGPETRFRTKILSPKESPLKKNKFIEIHGR